MDRLDRLVTQGTKAVLGLLMCLMILLVFAQVVFCYFVGLTPFFVEEVSRGLLIWVGCFGASLALRRSQHIGVDYFLSLPRLQARETQIAQFGRDPTSDLI